jgi:hypothetical protein
VSPPREMPRSVSTQIRRVDIENEFYHPEELCCSQPRFPSACVEWWEVVRSADILEKLTSG